MFSVVNGILLRPLPYEEPDRLVRVSSARNLTGLDEPAGLRTTYVSEDFFEALGTGARLGRAFSAEEARRGERVVVLSYAVWRDRFGGDPSVIGTVRKGEHMSRHTSPLTSIQQIAIRVLDLDRAIATYRDKLGLRFLFRAPPALAFFECGGIRLMLSPPEPGEFDHPASPLYFNVEDIENAYAELAERGVNFRSSPHQIADLGDRVLWLSDFEDGEGNVFALMAEIPKDASMESPMERT